MSIDGHDIHPVTAFIECHFAVDQRKERPIPAGTDVAARYEFGAALTDENTSGGDKLAAEAFHPQPLAYTVTSIADTSLTFLVCHILSFNFRDFNACEFLPVSHRAMIALATFHLESDLLLAPQVLYDIGPYRRMGDG